MQSTHRFFAIALVILALQALGTTCAFQPSLIGLQSTFRSSHLTSSLNAKKKKKPSKNKAGSKPGMGFGAPSSSSASVNSSEAGGISPSKKSLEAQWESYVLITMLEMKPLEDTEDTKYRYFETADVFARGEGTGWFRLGKVVAADHIPISTSLALQNDLVLWTAARMYEQLKATNQSLELGYTVPGTNYLAFETDGPLDEEESAKILPADTARSAPMNTKKLKTKIGFRPDFGPPGYKFTSEGIQMDLMQNMGESIADAKLLSKMFGGGGANVLGTNMSDGISSIKEGGSTPPDGAHVVAGELEGAMDSNDFDTFLSIMREADGDLEEEEARKTFDMLRGLKAAVNEEKEEEE